MYNQCNDGASSALPFSCNNHTDFRELHTFYCTIYFTLTFCIEAGVMD